MRNIKKIISMILLYVLLINAVPAQSTSASANEYFDDANALLVGLGFDDATSKRTEYISRDTFVDILIKNSYYDQLSRDELAMAGIFSDTNYYFHPSNNISFKDALILCVKLLGIRSDNINDFELLKAGTNLKLFKGVGTDLSVTLTYEQAYVLIYNYITADLTSYNAQYPYIGNSILNDKHGIYTIYGIADAAGIYSISAKTVDNGRVSIDGIEYNCDTPAEELFGRYITAYVREEGKTDRVICAVVDDKSHVTELYPDNEACFSNNVYEYVDKDKRTKSAKISVKADIFYNGCEHFPNAEGAVPESGKVTIIDNGIYSDGADIVIIESGQAMKVSGINKSNETIFCQGMAYKIEDTTLIFDTDGKKLTLADITVGDILNICQDKNGNIYKIVKLLETVSGKIEEVSTYSVIIEGKSFKITSRISREASELLGNFVTLVTDEYNTAVHISEGSNAGGLAGIILATKHIKKSFDDSLIVKIFTEDGISVQYGLDKKCLINNKSYDSFADMHSAIPKIGTNVELGIVRYELSADGLITALDFPGDTLMDTECGADIYKTGEDKLKNLSYITYKKWSEIFGEGVFINSSTKVFRIPNQASDGTIENNEDLYSVFTCSSLTNGTNYTATSEGYSLDKNDKVADYVVMRYDGSLGAEGVPDDTRLFMVGDVSQVIKSNGDEIEAVTVYNKNNPSGRVVYGKSLDYFSSMNIAGGDLIRISYLSNTSDVKAAELVYKKGALTLADGNYIFSGNGGGAGQVAEIRLCNVIKNWNPVVDLAYANINPADVKESDIKPIKASLYSIFRYNDRTGTVETVTLDELYSYEVAGDNCTKLVFDDRWFDPFSIFIVN